MGWEINSTPRSFYPPERDPIPTVEGGEWPQGRIGLLWNISPSLGLDPRTVQAVASRYAAYAIPAQSDTRGNRI